MVFEHTTIDSIIARASIGNGVKIPIGDIMEYTGQVMDGLRVASILDTSVIFISIFNNKGILPPGIVDIKQVAKYNYNGTLSSLLNPKTAQDKINSSGICPKTVYEEIVQTPDTVKPSCTCYKEPLLKVETVPLAIRYFEIGNIIHDSWFHTSIYRNKFIPVYRTTNTMFNILECDANNIDVKFQNYQYNIKAPNIICSFSEGIIALSVTRLKLDNKGFPLIPRNEYLERAILSYCKWRYYQDMLAANFTNQYKYLSEMYKDEYYTDYSYALSDLKTKGLIDSMENLYKSNDSLIPKDSTYTNFFSSFHMYDER